MDKNVEKILSRLTISDDDLDPKEDHLSLETVLPALNYQIDSLQDIEKYLEQRIIESEEDHSEILTKVKQTHNYPESLGSMTASLKDLISCLSRTLPKIIRTREELQDIRKFLKTLL